MKAIITGASSGLGKEFAKQLSKKGYDLVLVARRKERLRELKDELDTNIEIVTLDLSFPTNCVKLFKKYKKENIDILINNAGFGVFGNFDQTPLDRELALIDINIVAVHTLTKLFLQKFKKENKGYILNVASSAAFQPGPLMSTYYASKSYVYNLKCAIYPNFSRLILIFSKPTFVYSTQITVGKTSQSFIPSITSSSAPSTSKTNKSKNFILFFKTKLL